MSAARIVIVSGPPGAGKSTIARRLAECSPQARAVHLHTDDFYAYIRRGYLAPWLIEASEQNMVVMKALALAAATYAKGGYEVLVDGIVGPWFFDPWLAVVAEYGIDLRYILLMPDEAATVTRATARTAPGALTDPAVVRVMWGHFGTYAPPAEHILDTTGQSAEDTFLTVQAGLNRGQFKLR
jgi:predicted kinase